MNLGMPITNYLEKSVPLSHLQNIVETRDTRAAEFLFIQFICDNQSAVNELLFKTFSYYLKSKRLNEIKLLA